MHISEGAVTPRRVDEALLITPLFDGQDFAFDMAKANLNGVHPPVVNRVSDRVYFFLKGTAKVTVDNREFDASVGDLVAIHAGQVHALEGSAEYLIITSPPFDPKNETVVVSRSEDDQNRK
jgi:mannose-6-phosphate isomerase-like protein (cupin superfamily)